MSYSLFAGLILFSVVSAFTPGPNNLLALASGANFGFRRTLPHIFGVCLGFSVMIALVGAGLGKLFSAIPIAYTILKYAAFSYLVYLSWKIATSVGIGNAQERSEPITLLGSAVYQWINPKAWIAAVTIVSSFTVPKAFWSSLLIGGITSVSLAFAAVSCWALFGTIVKKWLSNPAQQRAFNWTMAILLVCSVIPALFH